MMTDGHRDNSVGECKLIWDEENRLLAVDDNGLAIAHFRQHLAMLKQSLTLRSLARRIVSNYWYDTDGERAVKISGESDQVYVNGVFSGGSTNTAKFSLYVSPYLVANQGGRYTKHIYAGSQRIVSKVGDFASYGSDPRRIEYAGANTDGLSVDYKAKYAAQQKVIKDNYKFFDVPYNGTDNDNYADGEGFCCNDGSMEAAVAQARKAQTRAVARSFKDPDNYENLQFFYHPDHLGSSSFITNLEGEVVQHIEYVPFGEVFIEERNNVWNTPYLFNAKEFDEETGMYYYGARYYEPRLSLWMSVDKSAIIAPGYSPYTFCKNNPNIMVDPNGNFPIFINGRVSDDFERGSASYWDKGLREMVKQKTGYYHSQFKFVDGDKGIWPSTRYNAGIAQGKADAAAIYAVLKSSAKDGVISEQLQIISHSRGSAFASGYMQSVSTEIRSLANKDNMTFSYGNDNIVEYSINIGPHQSNYISYEESGTVNVNISHFGDVLSGNDATGNVINIHSCMAGWEQHGNATFIPELEFVLPVLEAGGSKSDIKKQLTNLYQQWNKKHPEQIKSTVE